MNRSKFYFLFFLFAAILVGGIFVFSPLGGHVKEAKAIVAGDCGNYVETPSACGSFIDSCTDGFYMTDLPDTPTEAKWQCNGCNVVGHCSAPIAPPLTVSCSPKTSIANVNDVRTFSASPAGGALPYSYLWSPLTCGRGTTNSTQQCDLWFGAPATYTQTVKVTDSTGKTGSDSCTVTVSTSQVCTPGSSGTPQTCFNNLSGQTCPGTQQTVCKSDGSGFITTGSCVDIADSCPTTKVCTPGATQSCSISGCAISAGGIQQCKDDGSGWTGCACKAACTANFTSSSINAGQSATFNATVSGWAFTQPVWSCSGGATANGNVTSSVSKTFTNVLSPISCQVGVAGYYGSTASCQATVNVSSVPKYRCSGGSSNTCIQDNVNGTLPAGCNNSCVQPPQCTLVISPSSASVQKGNTVQFNAFYDPDGPSGSQGEQNVNSSASWWSDNSSIAQSQGSGRFLGANIGSAGVHSTYSSCVGKQADATLTVTSAPNNPPVINSCDINPKSGNAPLPTNYTSSVTDPDGDPISIYRWNFGLGNADLGPSGNFTYNSSGNYTVTLQVQDSRGAWSSQRTCGIVNVGTAPPQNQLPIGFHDNNDNASCTVNGWATDPDDRNIDLVVNIYSDGARIKSVTANQIRGDLNSAGVCPGGSCGFSASISGFISNGVNHKIQVKAVDIDPNGALTGQKKILEGSDPPKDIVCSAAPRCGDGTVNQQSEQCDDGNTTSGDGCSSSCQIEAPQNITVSGRVYNQTSGAGFGGATIDTCWFGTKTTDSNGNFSFTAHRGDGFCIRASPETRSGFNGPFLNNNATVDQTFKTYEHQVAGKNCPVEGCYTEANIWDRASDSGYDFRYQSVSSPSCDTSYPSDQYHVCYFDGTNPPSGANPVLAQNNEAAIDHDWGSGQVNATGKSDDVSAIWRGRINFSAGNYIFHTLSDDGVALNLDGFGDIISNWTEHAPTQNNSAQITLPAGYRNVTLTWFEKGGGARVKLWWDFTPPLSGPSCPDAPASITPNGQTITVTSDPAFITLSWAGTSDTAFYDVRLDDGTSERYHHPAWTSTVCGGSTSASPHYVCEDGIFATSLAGVQVHPGKTYAYWVDPVPINSSCPYVNKGGSFSVVRESGSDGDGDGGGCNDECPSETSRQCVGNSAFQTCGRNFDDDGCLEWGPTPPNSCNPGEQCISGSCAALPPNPPDSFTASAGPACNLLTFVWSDSNNPPANSFTISCNAGTVNISGLTGNSYTFSGAEGNTLYNCSIAAVRSGLSSTQRPATGATTPKCPDFGLTYTVPLSATLSTAGSPKDTNVTEIFYNNLGTPFDGMVTLSYNGKSGEISAFTITPHFSKTTIGPNDKADFWVTVSGAKPPNTYNGSIIIKGTASGVGEKTISIPLKVEVKSPGFQEI